MAFDFSLSLFLKGRVPLQAAEDLVQDPDLPPERRREGTGVPADRRRRELEAGDQDGSGQSAESSLVVHKRL